MLIHHKLALACFDYKCLKSYFNFSLFLGTRPIYRKRTDLVRQSFTLVSKDFTKENSIKSNESNNDNLLKLPIVDEFAEDYKTSKFSSEMMEEEENL